MKKNKLKKKIYQLTMILIALGFGISMKCQILKNLKKLFLKNKNNNFHKILIQLNKMLINFLKSILNLKMKMR